MPKTTVLLIALILLANPLLAATKQMRLIGAVDRLSCTEALSLGTADYTKVVDRPSLTTALVTTGKTRDVYGVTAYVRGLGQVSQSKHDVREWDRTRRAAVAAWDRFVATAPGEGWLPEYEGARLAIDRRAHRVLGHEAKNPEQLVAVYGVFRDYLASLHAESAEIAERRRGDVARGERELRVRPEHADHVAKIVPYLKTVTPRGGPALPEVVRARLASEPQLRDFFRREIQFLRRLTKVRADNARRKVAASIGAAITLRLQNTYALLAKDVSPGDIAAARRAQVGLRTGWDRYQSGVPELTLLQREQVLSETITMPKLRQIVIEAGRDLPDEVPVPAVPVPPTKPVVTEPKSRFPKFMRLDGHSEEAERLRDVAEQTFAGQSDEYARKVLRYNADEDYGRAQDDLIQAHLDRINARWAYLTYLANLHAEWFANVESVDGLLARIKPVMDARAADGEAVPSSGDVEHAANNVVFVQPEPTWELLRRWLRVAFVMVPRLLGQEVSRDDVPVIPGDRPIPRPEKRELTPIPPPESVTEEPSTSPFAATALGVFPTPEIREDAIAAEEDAAARIPTEAEDEVDRMQDALAGMQIGPSSLVRRAFANVRPPR